MSCGLFVARPNPARPTKHACAASSPGQGLHGARTVHPSPPDEPFAEDPMSQSEFPTFETILYDEPRPAVARITLNRPEKRNAQNMRMTYDLNAAFDHAVRQAHIKVIV